MTVFLLKQHKLSEPKDAMLGKHQKVLKFNPHQIFESSHKEHFIYLLTFKDNKVSF